MSTVAVILAAGRGSRMRTSTADRPKCLLELGGRPLLHWQLDALAAAGIERTIVVRGYMAETLQGNFDVVDNPRWIQTNMVQSLLCAFAALGKEDALVAYADIVYRAQHVRDLMASSGDIALSYDVDWLPLWTARNENPLDDAETFRQQDGLLQEIGNKPRGLDEVAGQYMGLLKLSCVGRQRILEYVTALPQLEADALDMTSLLRGLLQSGCAIHTVPVHGGWCECDTESDLEIYENLLSQKTWQHDWRQ
ncbi:NTP transferase domain-containing protein [Oleidesulfovibrio sp.]|uniref:phosphocholine cytidylyltransferase family protein n=1 Tax=Oleidesulfovibrio sp. TaxID=2909707 RepID=UPI003A8A3004